MIRSYLQLEKDEHYLLLEVGDEVICGLDTDKKFEVRKITKVEDAKLGPPTASGVRVWVTGKFDGPIAHANEMGLCASWCTAINRLYPEEYYEAKLKDK